jgi:hypothetical protein
VPTHGFTRQALALSAVRNSSITELPPETNESIASASMQTQLDGQLSEVAIDALFGRGDAARRTLINAWLESGKTDMSAGLSSSSSKPTVKDALERRLNYNFPVLGHLPEVCIYPVIHLSSALTSAFRPLPSSQHRQPQGSACPSHLWTLFLCSRTRSKSRTRHAILRVIPLPERNGMHGGRP